MEQFIQYVLYFVIMVVLAIPLGKYLSKVMKGEKTIFTKLEKGIYRILKIDESKEMNWKTYLVCVLLFSLISFVFVTLLQMLQGYLPFNPNKIGNVKWDLAINTAMSFTTNTNWQAYSGESTLSYLTQFLGLTVQNFVTPAVAIAVLFAMCRGFIRTKTDKIGNFYVDLTRSLIHFLIPINLVVAVMLMAGGVIQNFDQYKTVPLLEPVAVDTNGEIIEGAVIDVEENLILVDGKEVEGQIVTEQYVPMGPAASQVAIKQTGTNGGGFMGVNSAHPLENPNTYTNLVEMISILLIPAACCFAFGDYIKNKKQGIAIFVAMSICLILAQGVVSTSEQKGTPQLSYNEVVDLSTNQQAGGNMEGKEARFGIVASTTWGTWTTAASNGSVNSMHDSYTPLGGCVELLLMQLGEVVFGGVGCGLYGMLAFAILTVFISGLMVGRTPEFLGKKIEPYDMKWAVVVCLATPLVILVGSGIAALIPSVHDSLNNPGAHGLSELLYAYSSGGGNNGSAFAGFNANTVFINLTMAIVMMLARFMPIAGILAIAGNLASKKQIATSAGTLSTTNAMFVFLLIFIVLLIGALSFFPALALGPIAEFLAI